MYAIDTTGLTKRFDTIHAVEDLTLRIPYGEVFGFLGPNGAGKSTTIGLLLDLIRPTSGAACVLGHDVQTNQRYIRRHTGVVPERCGLYPRLTAREHLAFAIDTTDADETMEALLQRVGLDLTEDRPVRTFSTGMAQRLRLALSLVGDPALLILDEPAAGLDPNGIRRLRELISEERERGTTVFFSSHSLEQVAAVCDRIGIMVDGHLRVDDTIDALRDASLSIRIEVEDWSDTSGTRLRSMTPIDTLDVLSETTHGDRVSLTVSPAEDSSKAEVLRAVEEVASVVDFTVEQGSLAALFQHTIEAAS